MTTNVTWDQALAWRMRRHYLDPVGDRPVAEVVRRLCGVQAQVASSAELGVRIRRTSSKPGEVARALREGRLIKTWAMRGTLHLLTPEEGGAFLALMASGRSWERASWQQYFGVSPAQIQSLRGIVREVLAGTVLTREELIAAIVVRRGLGHIGDALRSGWGTLLKPLAWQGDLAFGPSRGNRVTFTLPEAASARWAGLPEPEAAAPVAIAAYLGAYGPATFEQFGHWLAGGWFGKKQLRAWFDELGSKLAEVDVGGDRRYILAKDLDALVSTKPTRVVRLLGGFDQYVMGPGTLDANVTPAKRRSVVSRPAGWISPVVLSGGVVRGTWELDGAAVRVAWFKEGGTPPEAALRAEVTRLGTILGRDLELAVGRRR